jgi:hypothetical protein
MTEPIYWTWNFFLTAVLVPLGLGLLWIAIKRQFTERDKKDEKIAALLTDKDDQKEKSIIEWKNNVTNKLCEIRVKLDDITEVMHDKVDWTHCNKEMDRHDDRIREIAK